MPLLEFECSACSRRFEDLVRGDDVPECPSCGGRKLRRLLSSFGVGVSSGPSPAAASSPGGG
jgi:putative FmdB family regulatory protein